MIRYIGIGVLGALCLVSEFAVAATTTTTTLPNGMQVHIHADEDLALTRVGMFFAAGRGNDPDSLGGLAHLAEHLLTDSSPAYPDGGLMRQSTLYATYRNAYTSGSFMQFDTQCLPEFLPQLLTLEVERLLGSGLDESSFAREKAVVQEELAYRRRRTPWSRNLGDLYRACYPGHPFGKPVGGTAASVARITLADFEAFRERNILPRRAALVVTGPVDAEQTLALIDSLFVMGPDAAPEYLEVPRYPVVQPVQIVTDSADFMGVKVSLACRVPLAELDVAVLAVALPLFLDSTRFSIGRRVVPGEIIISLSTHFKYNRPPSASQQKYGYIYRDFDPNQDAQYALAHLWEGLDEEMGDLSDPELFANRRETALLYTADWGADHGVAMVNGNTALTANEIQSVLTDLTYEQLAAFVLRYIAPDWAGVGVTHGSDSDRQQAIALADRIQRDEAAQGRDALADLTQAQIEPVLAAYGNAGLQLIHQVSLSNGIPLMYLELPGLTNTKLGGCRVLPPLKVQKRGSKPGIAQIYSMVVRYDDRQRRDPDEPQYRPRKLPYDLRLLLLPGQLRYSVYGPETKIKRMVFHLERRLKSQNFNQERWSRTLRFGHDYLADIANMPDMRAEEWRYEQVLGTKYFDLGFSHPDPDIMDKIRYKDLVKLHKNVAGPTGQTVLYGAGSLPLDELVAALEPSLGRRKKFKLFTDKPPAAATLTRITGRVVSNLSSSHVALKLTFPIDETAVRPDVATELLLQTVLRQALLGRVREAEGLTYAVRVDNQPLSGLMLREVQVTCQPGQAHLVLAAIREELNRITDSGFTEDEVARARLSLTGYLIRSCSDQDDGFNLLQRLAAFGPLPDDLLGDVAALDTDRVNELTRRALSADRFAFTAVGPMFEEDIEMFEMD